MVCCRVMHRRSVSPLGSRIRPKGSISERDQGEGNKDVQPEQITCRQDEKRHQEPAKHGKGGRAKVSI